MTKPELISFLYKEAQTGPATPQQIARFRSESPEQRQKSKLYGRDSAGRPNYNPSKVTASIESDPNLFARKLSELGSSVKDKAVSIGQEAISKGHDTFIKPTADRASYESGQQAVRGAKDEIVSQVKGIQGQLMNWAKNKKGWAAGLGIGIPLLLLMMLMRGRQQPQQPVHPGYMQGYMQGPRPYAWR
jgi:hypothetical protein